MNTILFQILVSAFLHQLGDEEKGSKKILPACTGPTRQTGYPGWTTLDSPASEHPDSDGPGAILGLVSADREGGAALVDLDRPFLAEQRGLVHHRAERIHTAEGLR